MAIEQEFQWFWRHYPRKVGKLAAEKVYRLVRKNGATMDDVHEGLVVYLQSLPADARFIPHPRTWLAQGRWMDEIEDGADAKQTKDWYDECQRLHDGVCGKRHAHEMAMTHGLLPCQQKVQR